MSELQPVLPWSLLAALASRGGAVSPLGLAIGAPMPPSVAGTAPDLLLRAGHPKLSPSGSLCDALCTKGGALCPRSSLFLAGLSLFLLGTPVGVL
jgi:hypothetical protein